MNLRAKSRRERSLSSSRCIEPPVVSALVTRGPFVSISLKGGAFARRPFCIEPTMSDESVLVCSRMDEPGFAPDTVGRPEACSKCGARIWVSLSSPATDHRWCTTCAVEQVKTGEPFKTVDLTEAQIADIKTWRAAQAKPQ